MKCQKWLVVKVDGEIITWIFLGVFALFIFFKFKKFLPFKQDSRSVNFYQTIQRITPKENVIRNIRTVTKKLPEPEPIEYDDDSDSRDEFEETALDNQKVGEDMFGFDDAGENEYEDIWKKTAEESADIADEMFGLKKKRRRRNDDDDWY